MVYLELIFGFLFLIVGGYVLVSSSVMVAQRIHVSSLLIGLLVVGFGTSLPELSTSLLSVAREAEGLAVGNVVGSNIANILLVLGVAAIINPIELHQKAFGRDAIFLLVSTIILLISLLKGYIGWELGCLMCMTLAFYIGHTYQTDKFHMGDQNPEVKYVALSRRFHFSTGVAILLMICGLVLTLAGANFLVNSVIVIAGHLGVSEAIIGLTVVAFGTSLPELATCIIASVKKESDVALGNVMGSNIYNTLFILGFTSLFLPVSASPSMKMDVLIMTGVTMLLLGIGWWYGRIGKKIGIMFLVSYLVYIIYLGAS